MRLNYILNLDGLTRPATLIAGGPLPFHVGKVLMIAALR